jgi:hypothetical protein
MSTGPFRRPLQGACLVCAGRPGVPLRFTPGFKPALFGRFLDTRVAGEDSGRFCKLDSSAATHIRQRRRREGAAEVLVDTEADCGSQPRLTVLGRKNNVIEQVAMGGTHSAGPFRRPSSGAALFLDHTPGVPLRSTPGFNPPHPPGAVEMIPISVRGQRPSAPEARGNKARSEAKQTPGMLHDIGKPLARGGGERVWAGRRISAGETK